MKPCDRSADDALFGSELWEVALEKFASATHLTLRLFDAQERAVIDPIQPTPLFQLFDETGYDPGLFSECTRQCLAQTEKRSAVLVSQFHGLAVVGASLMFDGRIVGAVVGGYAFADFSQVSEIQRLARQAGIDFERVWEIARKQPPIPRQRLIVQGELLQILGDALLREKYRSLQYEQAAAIVNSSDDAIIAEDLDGVIMSWNFGAERLFGFTDHEVVGKPIAVLMDSGGLNDERDMLEHIRRGEKVDHYETVYQRKDRSSVDISLTASPMEDAYGRVVGLSKIARDITERKQAEQRQQLLLNELAHRGRNLLAVIQAIVSRSLSGTKSLAEAREVLLKRIQAIAHSQTVLLKGAFLGGLLAEIIRLELEAFADRVKALGPDVMLNPKAAQTFALLVHELATNAIKYGALSRRGGGIVIHWSIEARNAERRFKFQWQERGGPRVTPPTSEGFGRTLIEKASVQDLGAQPTISFAPDGLSYEIDAPLSEVAASER